MESFVYPVAYSAFSLLLFGYLIWVRPDGYLLSWAWAWVAFAARLTLLGLYPSPSRPIALASEGLLLLMLTLIMQSVWRLNKIKNSWLGLTWTIPVVAAALALGGYVGLIGNYEWVARECLIGVIAVLLCWKGWDSVAQRIFALALIIWGVALMRGAATPLTALAMPALCALCMLGIVYEQERDAMERNLRDISVLDLEEPGRLASSEKNEAERILQGLLERLSRVVQTRKVAVWVKLPNRDEPMTLCLGFSPEFMPYFRERGGPALNAVIPRFSGLIVARELESTAKFDALAGQAGFAELCEQLHGEDARGYACALLQTKSQSMGMLLAARTRRRDFLPSEIRLLLAMAGQTSVALENLEWFQQSLRRGREFEILTDIGTALSSALDGASLLRLIHAELGKVIDVRNFYVAFLQEEPEEVRFALEIEDGRVLPARRRRRMNALTEHVIATGRPLLLNRDIGGYCQRNGLTRSGRQAQCWLGVPLVLQGRPRGVIAVQSYDRVDAFDSDHLHVLEILATQAAVAMDNARLFSEVQRDARQMAFLNQVARLTISTLRAPEVLNSVVEEIAKVFHFDHIAIGIVNSRIHALEFRAQAQQIVSEPLAEPSVPLGTGIAGAVALTGEMILAQDLHAEAQAVPLHACSRSVLALPISYGGQTLGVLNLESHTANAFEPDQVLVMQTLTDQMAVSLNHALVFQQMQHQAVTDSLTGLKTRRFFMEALDAEYRHARRTGECFCIVLVDLDRFKRVNDTMGHHAGDQVLMRVARVLEQNCRASSVVARYGGDEFTILLPGCHANQGRMLAQRLQEALRRDLELLERGVEGSFGLAAFPESGATPEELLHVADANMYLNKQDGARQPSSTG